MYIVVYNINFDLPLVYSYVVILLWQDGGNAVYESIYIKCEFMIQAWRESVCMLARYGS